MDKPPAEGEPLSLKGSVMLAMAGSKDEVLEKLRADPYFEANVWDFEKVSAGLEDGMMGERVDLLTSVTGVDSDLPVQERHQEGVVRRRVWNGSRRDAEGRVCWTNGGGLNA